MRFQRISFTFLVLLTTTALVPSAPNWKAHLGVSPVLAQATDAQATQIDQLLQQGFDQYNNKHFQAALQYFQQILTISHQNGNPDDESMALVLIADTYSQMGNDINAIEYAQQSLSIRRQHPSDLDKKVAFRVIGYTYIRLKEYAKAIEYLKQWLTMAEKDGDRQEQTRALDNLGFAYYSLKQYQQAIEIYQQLQGIAQATNDSNQQVKYLFYLGRSYEFSKQYQQAIEVYQQGLRITQVIGNRHQEAALLAKLAVVSSNLYQYAKAIEYSQQSLAIAREIHDHQFEGIALGSLGEAYLKLGDYAKSIEYETQLLAITKSIQDRKGEGIALSNLGEAYLKLGDYAKAIEYQQQSLAISRELKDRQSEGAALGKIGEAYHYLGDYAKAIEYEKQWLAIAQSIQDRQSEGKALSSLGGTYRNLGDYAKAIEYSQQSLVIAKSIQDRQSEGAALNNLGGAYLNLGDYAKAIEYHEQSLAIQREIKDRFGEGVTLGNLGVAYLYLGDYAKAIEYQQQSLAISREIKDRQGEGATLGHLGGAYLFLGDYAKAIEYEKQWLAIAQSIQDRQSEGIALGNIGGAYFYLGDYAKAIEYEKQWLAIAQSIQDHQNEGNALNNLGLALLKSHNLVEAERTLRAAIQVWENLRADLGSNDANKVSIFEQQARTYRTLQQVLIAQNNPNAALEIAERGRARAFVELLTRRNTTTSDSANSPITPPTIELLQQIAKQQNATLVEYSIIYDNFKINGKQEYRESELYIWVIKPTGEVTFRKADLKPLWQKQDTSLADLVFTSRDSIGVRSLPIIGFRPRPGAQQKQEASLTEQLQQLHKLLIEPIADLLPTDPNAHVVFMPQRDLFLVPFPALKDRDGKYLIEKHTILTAPSIQVLQLTHQQRQRVGANSRSPLQGNDALVVGNPTMPSVPPEPGQPAQQLPSLPGAETEANAIAPLLNTKPLIGNLATKSAIVPLLAGARIIHLATHGLLDDVRGLGSAIALAPDPSSSYKEKIGEVNGLLTAEEILDMKLNAELVVLSACNTGRGRITGDGVIGLSRSLISAGVPSVMVSLWSVPDAPTASLMTEFYRNLQQNPDKAQALRSAMLTIMKQRPEPKNWAAFTLIGEAE